MNLQKAISAKTALTTLTLTFIIVLTIVLLTMVFGSADDVDIVIENNVAGEFANNISNELTNRGATLADVTSITVTGSLYLADLNWFASNRHSLTKIETINLEGATATYQKIPDNFMDGRNTLKQFKYPVGITSIGKYAFQNCSQLTGNLTIQNTVTNIGEGAFYGCYNLTGNLIIPNSVTDIGQYAFYNCYNLTGDLVIPNSVMYLRGYVFYGCTGFGGTLTISNSAKSIGTYAFYNCYNLTENLVIPDLVENIGPYAFYNCYNLTGDLVIPDLVITIGKNAFERCLNLNSLTIGNSVKYIFESAFQDCNRLTGNLVIPNSVINIGAYAFRNCRGLTGDLVIPNSITSIGSGTFSYCEGFTGTLIIPDSVTNIENQAFNGCVGLTEITMPYNVTLTMFSFTNVGYLSGGVQLTFTYPSEITQDELDAVTETDMKTKLSSNTGLTLKSGYVTNGIITRKVFPIRDIHIVIENNVAGSLQSGIQEELLKEEAELGNVLSVTVTGELSQEDLNWLRDNNNNLAKMYKIDLEGASAIGYVIPYGFMIDNITLEEIKFPTGIIDIEGGAFAGCSKLTGIVIPNSVTHIGDYAFNECTSVTGSIVIPESVTSIEYSAFANCNKVTEVILPLNVELTFYGDQFKDVGSDVGGIKLTFTYPSETKASQLYVVKEAEMRSKLSSSQGLIINEGYVSNYKITGKIFPLNPYDIDIVIENNIAGGLSERIYEELLKKETLLENIVSVTVTGELSQEDLDWLKDNRSNLAKIYKIDLEGASATELKIPNNFMDGITTLKQFKYPIGITSIGNYAFRKCSGLTGNLIIPNTVISIGTSAFQNCSGLDGTLAISSSAISIESSTFYGCSGLIGELIIPSSVTSIGVYAFRDCSQLTGNLIIPDSVTVIGSGAFQNCSGLNGTLTIPDSITNIGTYVFNNCSGLTGNLEIPSSIINIETGAFNNCSGLTGNLEIPNSVISIGQNAFNSCKAITGKLVIPNSVTSIGIGAFSSCSGLTELTVPYNIDTIAGTTSFNFVANTSKNLKLTLVYPNTATKGELELLTETDVRNKIQGRGVLAANLKSGYVTNGTYTRKVFPDTTIKVNGNIANVINQEIDRYNGGNYKAVPEILVKLHNNNTSKDYYGLLKFGTELTFKGLEYGTYRVEYLTPLDIKYKATTINSISTTTFNITSSDEMVINVEAEYVEKLGFYGILNKTNIFKLQ